MLYIEQMYMRLYNSFIIAQRLKLITRCQLTSLTIKSQLTLLTLYSVVCTNRYLYEWCGAVYVYVVYTQNKIFSTPH